jgi:hypothetical protein
MKKLRKNKMAAAEVVLVEEIGTECVGPLVDLVWMFDKIGPVSQALTLGSQAQVHTPCKQEYTFISLQYVDRETASNYSSRVYEGWFIWCIVTLTLIQVFPVTDTTSILQTSFTIGPVVIKKKMSPCSI